MVRSCLIVSAMSLCGLWLSGCTKSSPPAAVNPTKSGTVSSTDSKNPSKTKDETREKFWDDYPDVPKVEIMTEVNGIKIPRMAAKSLTNSLTGAIPADVDNELAKRKPSQPVTGDTLTIRFNAEPKVLNPITESSAVQTYIMQYVNEGLARQNPETFEFEPGIAKKWIVEDSIKLSPDYPGRERRVSLKDGTPQASLEIDYEVAPPVNGKPAEPKKNQFGDFGQGRQTPGSCLGWRLPRRSDFRGVNYGISRVERQSGQA